MKKFLTKIKSLFWGDEKLKNRSSLFLVLIVISTVALLVSNVIANKLFPLFGWSVGGFELTMTCAVILFPITYILSDVFSEVYGYSASRRASWIGFGANVLMVFIFCIADLIPAVGYQNATGYATSFHTILGIDFTSGWGPFGTLLASLIAFIIGSWIDDIVFEKIKNITTKNGDNKGKFILRAVLSSFCGEMIDSIIFIPFMLLFAGLIGTAITSIWQVVFMILIQTSIKTLYELLISPLTAIIAKKVKDYELKKSQEK